ncbi:MAG: zinc-dependent metalloprotease [Ignavibacteriales bacterium]|nr:zinc-dependent metalloprotease [Ignavibacteriales bacterium]
MEDSMKRRLLIAMTALAAFLVNAVSQQKPETPATKSIKDVIKASRQYEGLFTLYQDSTDGTVHMLVRNDQINKEYIYFSFAENGVVAAGYFRGAYTENKTFSVRKYFNRIEFVAENTGYYFDRSNALHRASDANISNAVLSSQKIVAKDSVKHEYLIKVDDVFLSEMFQQIKPSPNPNVKPGTVFTLGNLNKDRTKIISIKNYPANTDVVVEYVYENQAPLVRGGREVTDPRYVSLKMQHSMIEVPQNDYEPRFDDPRVGFFTEQVNDLTSNSATPYRDLINRWNLKKKDPAASLSEPVEPIVWWIENTTPVNLRETIRKAALAWNVAFEAAGFKNAVQVNVQPEDATWDAGDIRYNVLRWTSSPNPPFGGYGPSFVNPRTGQILGADVMLEYIYVTNRLMQEELFDLAGLHLETNEQKNPRNCQASLFAHENALFGMQTLHAMDATDSEKNEFLGQSLYFLVLHEIGHTLGLNHNMKASNLLSPQKMNDKEWTSKNGLYGSVMDYPAVNIASDRKKQGEYFITIPGPYDRWAIEFGYSTSLTDKNAEKTRHEKILSRSTEPALMFGNDADDMRSPGAGIDPRVMINDMSSDAVSYSIDRLKLTNTVIGKIKTKYSKPGQSYHELRNAFLIATGQYSSMVSVISRFVGGVYVDRGFVGQTKTGKPLTPVSRADQKKAMQALKTHLFSPGAFKTADDLFGLLQVQRRGFSFFGTTEDPKLTDRVLNIQRNVVNHLLHPVVMKRLNDSRMYGNQYSLAEMMSDLTDGIFQEDLKTEVNVYRQNLQLEYVNRLTAVLTPEGKSRYNYTAQSQAVFQLKAIERMLKVRQRGNAETAAHTQHILMLVQKAFEAKA